MKVIIYLLILGSVFCLSVPAQKAETPAQKDPSQQAMQVKEVPIIRDGLAQVVPGFEEPDEWIRHDLWVETEFDSDGDGKRDRMHVDVTRPQQTEDGVRLPVIYVSSPYFAGTGPIEDTFLWDVKHELHTVPPVRKHFPPIEAENRRPVISRSHVEEWVPYGFIVVHSSAPGAGLSEGCPTVGGANEALAPKAVIDWLNGRANGYTTPDGNEKVKAYWTTGKVGMTGTSYNGTIPLAAATTGVEGLEAIIPVAPNTSYYHYYRSNGLVRHPGGWLGEDIDYLYDWIFSGNRARYDYCNQNIRDLEMLAHHDRVSGDYNEFWAERDYLHDLGPLKAAVFMAHAFNDWNVVPEHSYRIIKALKEKDVPLKIYYHQGGHGGEPPFELMNRWFTRFLFGVENGAEDGPMAWIVREGEERNNPTPYADYPHPDAEPVTFHLTPGAPWSGGLVQGEPSAKEVTQGPAKSVSGTSSGEIGQTMETPPGGSGQGTETLVDNFSFSGEMLARAEWTRHRLIYLTPVLKDSLHISGISSISIRLSSSKPSVNLSVWLVSLPWNDRRSARITDNIITRGWADPQNYRSLTESEPLIPGKFYEMTFDLQPDDQIIPPGQQVGLMIFSSDRDFTLWPDPGTELTVDLDGTSLVLPVVGGADALERCFR
jgi:X-Pro dipeptidyl-peptidase